MTNVLRFPTFKGEIPTFKLIQNTPQYDKLEMNFINLSKISSYDCKMDIEVYKALELRFGADQPKQGVIYKDPFKIYGDNLILDSYGFGCTNDVVYCKKRSMLKAHGLWNKPFPMPSDITAIWRVLYNAFETKRASKYRELLKNTVLQFGYFSDPLMFMDMKYKIGQEILRMLDHYGVKYQVNTRSDLAANDKYMGLLNKDAKIVYSMATTNDAYNALIEGGAPSVRRRLKAAQKLIRNGYNVGVKVDVIPIYENGYFSEGKKQILEPLNITSFEMVDEIASHGVNEICFQFVEFTSTEVNRLEEAIGRSVRTFFSEESRKNKREYVLTDSEMAAYFDRFKAKCQNNGVFFKKLDSDQKFG